MKVAHRLREKAKMMIEIARTQDEEVGDGTTSVSVLTAEMMGGSHQFLEEKRHPNVVILKDTAATKINLEDASDIREVIQSCDGTKFIARGSDLTCDIAMDAVKTLTMTNRYKKEIDPKR